MLCACVHMCKCVCTCVCMRVCVCVCARIKERDTERAVPSELQRSWPGLASPAEESPEGRPRGHQQSRSALRTVVRPAGGCPKVAGTGHGGFGTCGGIGLRRREECKHQGDRRTESRTLVSTVSKTQRTAR